MVKPRMRRQCEKPVTQKFRPVPRFLPAEKDWLQLGVLVESQRISAHYPERWLWHRSTCFIQHRESQESAMGTRYRSDCSQIGGCAYVWHESMGASASICERI